MEYSSGEYWPQFNDRRKNKVKKILGNEKFFLTYGDGVSNVNLRKLLNYHQLL